VSKTQLLKRDGRRKTAESMKITKIIEKNKQKTITKIAKTLQKTPCNM